MKDSHWRNEHVYAEFDKLICHFEKWIAGKTINFSRFHKEVVGERIVQRLVQLVYYPFGYLCVQKNKEGLYPFPGKDEKIELDKIFVDTATGKISLGSKVMIDQLSDFFWQWVIALQAILVGYFTKKKWEGPITFIFGITTAEIKLLGNEEAFIEFCKKGPIPPLAEAHRLVIQSPEKQNEVPAFLQYALYPVYEAVKKAKLGFLKRTGLLIRHLFLPFYFGLLVIRRRLMSLLAKDIIQASFVSCLDKAGIIQSTIITNSVFFQQFLWMRQPDSRSFKVHELHYSKDATPFVFKNDPFSADFPALRHVKVDEHWVWTEGYKEHLIHLGHKGPVHVVGPILWYLHSKKENFHNDNVVKVAVFDITPVYPAFVEKLGIMKYYYNLHQMIQFISNILEAAEHYTKKTGRGIQVILKSKRAFKKGFHDINYEEFINRCEKENAHFSIVSYTEDIFSFLDECDTSVSIPYTSVPYVSSFLEKPAIYFDPSGELLFTNEKSDYIHVASGKEALFAVFEKILPS